MSIFSKIEDNFEAWWNNHVKPFISYDLEPVLKTFVQQFDSQFGQQALTAALSVVQRLENGEKFGDVVQSILPQLMKDAKTDAGLALKTVQSALQVAKISADITAPSDQNVIASISK